MLFNSLPFVLFLPVVLLVYYGLPQRWRWVLLLVASYTFYMFWRWEYAGLLVLSTVVDYVVGLRIEQSTNKQRRRALLAVSLLVNLGLLAFFKYQLFFVHNTNALLAHALPGYELLYYKVLLPVGISFYTFQTLSYTIDIYRGTQRAERHLGYFAVYVSYFPQLVAGPIERPANLLPQLREPNRVTEGDLVSGLRLMLWGYFKKLVVADNVSEVVDHVYTQTDAQPAWAVLVAGALFSVQIYADFSGYSDIAIGTARLMGHKLMLNFSTPLFARSLTDYWRRWHISLSSWFRDYVYIPLGGSRGSRWQTARNIVLTFVISGLWHGANWTFVLWGLLHGIGLAVERLIRQPKTYSIGRNIGGRALTLTLVVIGLMLFRAENLPHFGQLMAHLFGQATLAKGTVVPLPTVAFSLIVAGLLLTYEWQLRRRDYPVFVAQQASGVRFMLDALLIALILSLGQFTSQSFLYFQF